MSLDKGSAHHIFGEEQVRMRFSLWELTKIRLSIATPSLNAQVKATHVCPPIEAPTYLFSYSREGAI